MKPKTVDEYIETAPKQSRARLKEMRKTIKSVIPDATESLKYGMVGYSYKRILVIFGGFEKHIGFYPTPSSIEKFTNEIKDYKHATGSVQFPLDQPLPLDLVKRMTQFRAQEEQQKDAKWKD